jgi:diguanylate cyclase (GGDEF)-like protein
MLREFASRGVAPSLQLHVFALVWAVDACLAPIGFLAAGVAQRNVLAILLVLPLAGLLLLMAGDRRKRIEQAQHRLEVAVRERSRLQAAVRRMGDAFAAKLDIDALLDIVLRGSIEALAADAGSLQLVDRPPLRLPHDSAHEFGVPLDAAGDAARSTGLAQQLEHAAGWALALPFAVDGPGGFDGAIGLARRTHSFQPDEIALVTELVAKAQSAAADILGHHALREQAIRDSLTGLGNRRKLAADAHAWFAAEQPGARVLILFDLNGFKGYNDTFGHGAGDALLTRLGAKLSDEIAPHGEAYRLGGDEFCAVLEIDAERVGRSSRSPRMRSVRAATGSRSARPTASCSSRTRPTASSTPSSSRTSACTPTSTTARPARVTRRATCSCAPCTPSNRRCTTIPVTSPSSRSARRAASR